MSHDPLSIADATLALARERNVRLSGADLQRIIYFANGMHLSKTRLPLVNGCFEAWRHGPVHPVIHNGLAEDPSNSKHKPSWSRWFGGPRQKTTPDLAPRAGRLLNLVLTHRLNCNAAHFAELARAKDAPWQFVVSQARARKTVNLRITTTIILERFQHHKVEGAYSEESETSPHDSPFTYEELTAGAAARSQPWKSYG